MRTRLHTLRLCVTGLGLALLLALLLAGCGPGGSSSSSEAAGGDPVASGGIGGTGKGTITSYGSIVVDEQHEYAVTDGTTVWVDSERTDADALRAIGTGLVADVLLGLDVDPALTRGTALQISVDRRLKGPVTAVWPTLQVFALTVVADGDTVLAGVSDARNLHVGDEVAVSGYADTDGRVLATRIARPEAVFPVWELSGVIGNLVPGTSFSIGPQRVLLGGVTPSGCPGGLANGARVEVKAARSPAFGAGSALDSVLSVVCKANGLVAPPGSAPLPALAEGLATQVAVPYLAVDGQPVLLNDDTVLHKLGLEDIVDGLHLTATGTLDPATGLLTAASLHAKHQQVRLIGPVASKDIEIGYALKIFGMRVLTTPFTKDPFGVVSSGAGDKQVRIHATLDGAGNLFATLIVPQGPSDAKRVSIRGPVSAEPRSPEMRVLEVTVDTTGTVLFLSSRGAPVSREAFFAALSVGSIVEATDGVLSDGGNLISAPRLVRLIE